LIKLADGRFVFGVSVGLGGVEIEAMPVAAPVHEANRRHPGIEYRK